MVDDKTFLVYLVESIVVEFEGNSSVVCVALSAIIYEIAVELDTQTRSVPMGR